MALEISILKGKKLERDGWVRFLYNFKIFGGGKCAENFKTLHCKIRSHPNDIFFWKFWRKYGTIKLSEISKKFANPS